MLTTVLCSGNMWEVFLVSSVSQISYKQITFKILEAINILGKIKIELAEDVIAHLSSMSSLLPFVPAEHQVLLRRESFLNRQPIASLWQLLRWNPGPTWGHRVEMSKEPGPRWCCWTTAWVVSEPRPALDSPSCVRWEHTLCQSKLGFLLTCSYKDPTWRVFITVAGNTAYNFITQITARLTFPVWVWVFYSCYRYQYFP